MAREEEEKGGAGGQKCLRDGDGCQKSPIDAHQKSSTNMKRALQVGGPMAPWLGRRRTKQAVVEVKIEKPDLAVSGCVACVWGSENGSSDLDMRTRRVVE